MPGVLLEEVNPFGNLQAVVEADERVCYLYLHGDPEVGYRMRAVWVRNHQPAPSELDVASMQAGLPPLNPSAYCRHPEGQPALRGEDLRVVWLPEGNGVALYERDQLLAIVAPWSGQGGFEGYARDAVGQGTLAWALEPDNVLPERFALAAAYWDAWEQGGLWEPFVAGMEARYQELFGTRTNRYRLSGEEWPPRALVRIPRPDSTVLLTLGMSLTPQPNVELYLEEPHRLQRVELGCLAPPTWGEEQTKRFAAFLGGLAGYPWTQHSWLGATHTVTCGAWSNSRFTAALLVDAHPAVATVEVGQVMGDPVNLLWLIPITEAERGFAERSGTQELLARLQPHRWREG